MRDGTIFYTLGSLLDAAIWERDSNPRVDQSLLMVAGAVSITLERFPLTRFDAKKYTILKTLDYTVNGSNNVKSQLSDKIV